MTTTVDHTDEQRYELRDGDTVIGFVTYQLRGSRIALLHTEVDDAYSGQGMAGRLVEATLADVRRRGLALLPFCPYVRSYLLKHPDQLDLVPASERDRFELPAVTA